MSVSELDGVAKPSISGPFYETTSAREEEPRGGGEEDGTNPTLHAKRVWMNEMQQRRLNGEYETFGRRLEEIVADSRDSPARLSAVRVNGSTLRSSFLAAVFRPYLNDAGADGVHNSTLADVLRKSRDVHHTLTAFDHFAGIEMALESAQSVLAQHGDVDLAMGVRERGKLWAKSSTDVGSGEGSANVSVRVRNLLGGLENLEGQASWGTRTTSAFHLAYTSPVPEFICTPSPNTQLNAQVFQAERDHSAYAGVKEGTVGARCGWSSTQKHGSHHVSYEAAWRSLHSLHPLASLSLRDAAGSSVKSAVAHTFTHDSRDDIHMSTRGAYVNSLVEYAGLGGSVSFLKGQLQMYVARPIDSALNNFLALSFRAGGLLPMGGDGSVSDENTHAKLFSDRFRLGGPTSVRMFGHNRMGPRDGEDHLGGDVFYSGGVSVITPFPKKPQWNLKCQGFVNAGQLVSLKNVDLWGALLKPSMSVGVGLVYRFTPIRVELNLGVPVIAATTDVSTTRPIQLGVGMEYL
ncbi:hypothetical protein E3P96_03298 [Wallemia ichthyophaga]|nr:hypothetical protein E3P96_03298 [Wallemia ichthyophaga]